MKSTYLKAFLNFTHISMPGPPYNILHHNINSDITRSETWIITLMSFREWPHYSTIYYIGYIDFHITPKDSSIIKRFQCTYQKSRHLKAWLKSTYLKRLFHDIRNLFSKLLVVLVAGIKSVPGHGVIDSKAKQVRLELQRLRETISTSHNRDQYLSEVILTKEPHIYVLMHIYGLYHTGSSHVTKDSIIIIIKESISTTSHNRTHGRCPFQTLKPLSW